MSLTIQDVRVRGLPHQWHAEAIASMQCDEIMLEDVDDPEELAKWQAAECPNGVATVACPSGVSAELLPHENCKDGWSLSKELPPELKERSETPDMLVELGTALGSAGQGKEPISLPI